MTLTIAKNILCPDCRRKLCKIKEYDNVLLIELKHKGAFMLSVEAIVGCIDCKKTYRINAQLDSIEEITI